MRHSPKIEADMFQWAGAQAEDALQTRKENMKLQETIASQVATVDKLKGQMNDFLKNQKEREDEMLEQFRQLLNTKKLKIRGKVAISTVKHQLTDHA